jgi:hypothetical protein
MPGQLIGATAAAAIALAAAPAAADGIIGTADGELPFEGLYVNDVAALNVTAFRASMTVDFRKVSRIEITEVDPQTQIVTIRITFEDSYTMPATFNLAENAPWIAIGSYGRANYSADALLNGDIQYVVFDHEGEDASGADAQGEPETQPDGGN